MSRPQPKPKPPDPPALEMVSVDKAKHLELMDAIANLILTRDRSDGEYGDVDNLFDAVAIVERAYVALGGEEP